MLSNILHVSAIGLPYRQVIADNVSNIGILLMCLLLLFIPVLILLISVLFISPAEFITEVVMWVVVPVVLGAVLGFVSQYIAKKKKEEQQRKEDIEHLNVVSGLYKKKKEE